MTRVDLPEDMDFERVSDAELASLIHGATVSPEPELESTDIGPEDLELAEPLFDYTEAEWISEIDLAFDNAFIPANRFERGVGYCENVSCAGYLKGTFLFMHEGVTFTCSACSTPSTHLVAERGIPDREGLVPFSTVRVEYCYEPSKKRFEEIIILSDESFREPGGTYTVLNPLCRTPKRAAKIAEAMLTVINQGALSDADLIDTPRTFEKTISFDKPIDELRKDLKVLEQNLMDNSFLQQTSSVFSASSEVELNLEEGDSSGPESIDLGGTTDPRPRVSPSGDSGARALHIHSSDQPGGVRPQRSESGLHSLQPVGRSRPKLRRGESQRRRGRGYRSIASKLCSAAGRYLSVILRGSS